MRSGYGDLRSVVVDATGDRTAPRSRQSHQKQIFMNGVDRGMMALFSLNVAGPTISPLERRVIFCSEPHSHSNKQGGGRSGAKENSLETIRRLLAIVKRGAISDTQQQNK